MAKTVVRSALDPVVRCCVDCSGDEVLTKQEFKDECDINRIMRDYGHTGVVPEVPGGMYGDFETVGDYQSAMEVTLRAQRDFAALPARVRARFENDPLKFVMFFADERNRGEAEELGLVVRKEPAPSKAPAPAAT